MDVDGDGGRREFGLRGQRRGTESYMGTAANSLSGYHAPGPISFDWVELGTATPAAAAQNSTRVLPARSVRRAAGSHRTLYLVQTP